MKHIKLLPLVIGLSLVVCLIACSVLVAPPSESSEWIMEGNNPRRDRATADNIGPPLTVTQEYTIGDEAEYDSPVVVADHILLAEGRYRLHAFDLDQTRELWSAHIPGVFVSPTVANDRILVRADSADHRFVIALNLDSGQRVWTYELPAMNSQPDELRSNITPPLVVDGLVLVGANQFFQALDAETGREQWVFHTDAPISSAAAVAEGTVFFTDLGTFHALDINTGLER